MANRVRNVLYVEDEETDVLLMQRAFTKVGLAGLLHVVTDGQAAVDYLAGAGSYADRSKFPPPTIVLLDLNLPEMNGFEVLGWIRHHPEHKALPVVIFSSSARDTDKATAKLLGANDYWHKPNSTEELRQVVQNLQQQWLLADELPSLPQPQIGR